MQVNYREISDVQLVCLNCLLLNVIFIVVENITRIYKRVRVKKYSLGNRNENIVKRRAAYYICLVF